MGGIREWIASNRPTIIYGAGKQAEILYRVCRLYGKTCLGVMTTSSTRRSASLPDEEKLPHFFPDTYKNDRNAVDVVVCIGGETGDIRNNLKVKGYGNVYFSCNWEQDNDWLRNGRTTGYKYCHELTDMNMNIVGWINKKDNAVIQICCDHPNMPRIPFSDTPEKTFDSFFKLRSSCISEYILGIPSSGGGTYI